MYMSLKVNSQINYRTSILGMLPDSKEEPAVDTHNRAEASKKSVGFKKPTPSTYV